MATTFRWLMRLFGLLFVLLLLSIVTVYYLAARSLPDYSRSHRVAGLSAPVEVVRDHANVPHIFGQTDADVYFALGFAHAQDRLWQMTMMRRTAQGRLSEQFGPRTLEVDKLIRRLDIYGLATSSVAAQDARTQAALTAYSAGVNSWLRVVNEEALGRGAPEFFLFSSEIAPWQPADSIAIMKLMGLQLATHLDNEVLRARVSLMLPGERLRDIMPDAPGDGIAALPDYAALSPSVRRYAAGSATPRDPLSPFPSPGLAGASNAWAAAPERSAAGGTLLASDPHLGFTAPSIWYLRGSNWPTGR